MEMELGGHARLSAALDRAMERAEEAATTAGEMRLMIPHPQATAGMIRGALEELGAAHAELLDTPSLATEEQRIVGRLVRATAGCLEIARPGDQTEAAVACFAAEAGSSQEPFEGRALEIADEVDFRVLKQGKFCVGAQIQSGFFTRPLWPSIVGRSLASKSTVKR